MIKFLQENPFKKKKKKKKKKIHMSRNVRKRTFGHVRPVTIQIRLSVRAVWSVSSLDAYWIPKDSTFLHVNNEDWSEFIDAQTNLSLRWAHMLEGTFSHVVVHLKFNKR